MSLNEQTLREHCASILNDRHALENVVVLCEGAIPKKLKGKRNRRSPESYQAMRNEETVDENLRRPDANFYHACIPADWGSLPRPRFRNCGDRNDVINTYFTLLKLLKNSSEKHHLNPEKLFAIVDLDLQSATTDENYAFLDTEAIFHDLYDKFKVNKEKVSQHRIWVTGLIHKEAYFLLPDLENLLQQKQAMYDGQPFSLAKIYQDMCQDMVKEEVLQNNFQRAVERIKHVTSLDCTDLNTLQISFSRLSFTDQQLVLALLTIKKAKNYWERISPNSGKKKTFKDDLLIQIGIFYSKLKPTEQSHFDYHIPIFMDTLRKCAFSTNSVN